MKTKHKTSIALTEHAKCLLKALADKAGMPASAWLEMLIRQEAKRARLVIFNEQHPH